MSKGRTITGHGPAKLTITSTVSASTGAWLKFGPFSGASVTAFHTRTDTASSQAARLDFAFTTESTVSYATVAVPFGNYTSAGGSSFGPKTSTGITAGISYNFIRLVSTEKSVMSTGRSMSVFVIAGNPTS